MRTAHTSQSSDTLGTRLQPEDASAYLQRLVAGTLNRKGFAGAEAGALAEMERLLENHIQRLFVLAQDYAAFSGRNTPFAGDLARAQAESGWDIGRLKREAKKRRIALPLSTTPAPADPPQPLTLASLPESGSDEKPRPQPVPSYAFDNAPPLPQPWTYKPDEVQPPPPPPNKVTSGVLDFIKLTATERGDIPPELGLVDYRRREGKRKWGVKGAGA